MTIDDRTPAANRGTRTHELLELDDRDRVQHEIDNAPYDDIDERDDEPVEFEDFWAEVIIADREADADSDWADL